MADPQELTIEVLKGHCLGGADNDVYPGHVLVAPRDLSIADALQKVRMGYARVIPNDLETGPEPAKAPEPVSITHGDPPIEHRDPAIAAPETARRGRFRTGGRKTE